MSPWYKRIPRAVKRVELLVAALATIAMYAVYQIVPRIDPRSGVDIWGSFAAIWPVIIAALLAGTAAWTLHAAFFHPLHDSDEEKLNDRAVNLNSWTAVALLLLDWLKWFAPFVLVFNAALGR